MKLSAEDFLKKYSYDSSHPTEVRRIAVMIFDEICEKIMEMPSHFRKLLENAALLHDIGYYIESKGHNKHSMKMIVENGIKGFDEHDTDLIACIARYHRGGLPDKEKHEIYSDLDKKDRKIVKRLGGILRIADGFDRAHLALIRKIKLNYDEDSNIVEFIVTPNTPDYYPDITSAIRKRDLFEIGFKTQSVIKFERP